MNSLGVSGEQQAKKYLIKQGYKVLETNYKTVLGEIDIVTKKDDFIVFVEVKTRSNTKFGLPRESVTPYKQNKIRAVATHYLKTKNMLNSNVRFDVIDILNGELTHITNNFASCILEYSFFTGASIKLFFT